MPCGEHIRSEIDVLRKHSFFGRKSRFLALTVIVSPVTIARLPMAIGNRNKKKKVTMRNDLSALQVFGQVAESGSFREAARKLQMARSSVSKRIGELERELGVVLINRSTRRISLTDAGRTLFTHWQSIQAEVDEAFLSVQDVDQQPSGTLRVSMPSSLGAALMPSLMSTFMKSWPDVDLSLDFRDGITDVVGRGLDAVLQFAVRLPDSRLTAKRLASTPCILAASPDYLAEQGMPRTLEDLRGHGCLSLDFGNQARIRWTFEQDDSPVDVFIEPAFAANSDLALILAACLGGGIIYTPRLLVSGELERGRLLEIQLEDAVGPTIGVYSIYPRPNPPAKVRVFIDFVEAFIARMPETDRWVPIPD